MQTEQPTHDTGRVRLVYVTDEGKQVSTYGRHYVEAFDRLVAHVHRVVVGRVAERKLDDEVTSVSGRDAGVTAARVS